MATLQQNVKRLQKALNDRGQKILFSQSEFYMEKAKRNCTMYSIKQAQWNDEKQKYVNVELFKTASLVQVVLFLRDLWFELNGWEVPTDNEVWEEAKRKNFAKESRDYGRQKFE